MAFSSYGNAEENGRQSLYTNLIMDVAAEIRVYWHTPASIGGGGNSFVKLDFIRISCPIGQPAGDNPTVCIGDEEKASIRLIPQEKYTSLRFEFAGNESVFTTVYRIYPNRVERQQEWMAVAQ